ncbi:MAG: LysM domain-containing protein [Myxococcota bacterium]
MSGRLAAGLVLWAGLLGAFVWNVAADDGYQHVVREGETLASISERYYGDPRREAVLVAENGLTAGGGAPIVVGLRLQIPTVSYHRVAAGETWAELARRFYGDSRRAFILVEANHGSSNEQPDEGAELLVPYPLRHVSGQNDNVLRIAKAYYGSGVEHARRLRRFNNLRYNRLDRGEIVLVPLSDLVLSEEGRSVIEQATGNTSPAGEVRELQAQIEEDLPQLQELLRRGRFAEAVGLGNRLLGTNVVTGNQIVTIQRELGTAYVALGHGDLATEAFRAALARQPDLQLDSVRTSPRVMRAFDRAKELQRPGAEEEADDADAGVDAEPEP